MNFILPVTSFLKKTGQVRIGLGLQRFPNQFYFCNTLFYHYRLLISFPVTFRYLTSISIFFKISGLVVLVMRRGGGNLWSNFLNNFENNDFEIM